MWRLRPLILPVSYPRCPLLRRSLERLEVDDDHAKDQPACLPWRAPAGAAAPVGKGVADLFPGRVVFGWLTPQATRSLHIEDGIDHVPGAAHSGPICAFACRKALLHNIPLSISHVTWVYDDGLQQILSLRTVSKLPKR